MRKEIRDCWRQSEEDLETARVNIETKRYYASVFFSQQAAEKALKAYYMLKLKVLPATHNLLELVKELDASPEIKKAAMELNPDYLTTRYFDAANGVPAEMYDEDSAKFHFALAKEVLEWTRIEIKKKEEE